MTQCKTIYTYLRLVRLVHMSRDTKVRCRRLCDSARLQPKPEHNELDLLDFSMALR